MSGHSSINPAEQGWTALIDDLVEGRWRDPETGELAQVPYESIVIRDHLHNQEAELVRAINLPGPFALVADTDTYQALGERLSKALAELGAVNTIILERPHADLLHVRQLQQAFADAQSVIAVGSGTINDLCKYATFQAGLRYCVFGTAASMNGYTSTTASIALDSGLKVSLPAHAPAGLFIDLSVNAQAPSHLAASGFGDCLCRSVAQIDWWLSHRLLETAYFETPFLIQMADERELNARAHQLPLHDIEATGYLQRLLTLCGLGVSFTGVSNHASMGEHQISHYIDCFARERHPGTLHGQQVGVTSLTMARIQQYFLDSETAPVLKPTRIDADDMAQRMGAEIAAQCLTEYRKKALDEAGAERLNTRLAEIWPQLRDELRAFVIPVKEMKRLLSAAGGPSSVQDLGLPIDFYREAVRHAHEMRNRFSFADIACDAGLLDDFAAAET